MKTLNVNQRQNIHDSTWMNGDLSKGPSKPDEMDNNHPLRESPQSVTPNSGYKSDPESSGPGAKDPIQVFGSLR